ncbi:hypothetical protein ILUMI_02572 [Ignelater luminosus]|uniref:Uncharacterized protein n=1 Tax=Ignelater luminosus TaxID=2038154 RepID=A0A8K0GN21_IGNLU|nr:hypothetical protein ILUMI_02572 [Ignelater luminosus]
MPDGSQGKRPRLVKDKRFGITNRLKIATWNVQGLDQKQQELDKILKKKNINIAVITKTKKKVNGTKDLAYLNTLYNNTQEARLNYIEKRNKAKDIVRGAQESWDKLISNIENDIHGRVESFSLQELLSSEFYRLPSSCLPWKLATECGAFDAQMMPSVVYQFPYENRYHGLFLVIDTTAYKPT